MNRRANRRLAVISLLTSVGATSCALVWPCGLVAQEAPAPPAKPTGAVQPDLTVTVWAYDFVQAPETLAPAQELATRIFRQAGIRLAWRGCLSSAAKNSGDATCTSELGSAAVVMRIVPRIKAIPGIHSDTNLGFAAGPYATVSFSRVLDLARESDTPPFLVLGRAMAHEIGHALLPSMPHSPEGIMRAHWEGADLKVAATNDMYFTGKQSERLRAEVLAKSGKRPAPEAQIVASRP